ncbi:MAG: ABC transporter ATP-binding protein [Anaerolineae bacterium]|nr:ABC transporter ATP-binding protein [Anaerolineae bacterium]
MSQDPRSGALISLSGLSFHYGSSRRQILSGMSLEIPAGAITAILGPNGSGKTTLLRLILGLLRPQQGEILIAGRPQSSYSRQELSRLIGLVPQQEHIPFDFTILEYVLMGRAPYLGPLEMPGEEDCRAAQAAIATAGLAHLHDRSLPNLSGGERQLATLARALAQKPRILLLDEPAAHLDLGNRSRLLEIMRALAAEGITQILTTHDPNLAASAAGFAVLVRHGQLLDAGPTAAILTPEGLSATYGVPVQVFQVNGRPVILLPVDGQHSTAPRPTPERIT